MVALWGCAPGSPASRENKPAESWTFRHRWWNYYARALQAIEKQAYDQAITDLETAIVKRDRDQRMARTYGMHFVDYFPHRELGVIYWETDRLPEALNQLETSVAQTPTAKALYYLDRVREKMIHRQMAREPIPTPPPAIAIKLTGERFRTRDDPVIIEGAVTDPNYISAVTVNSNDVFMDGAREKVDFHQRLDLPQGVHRIGIQATSLSGLTARKEITVVVDRQGPLISVQAMESRVVDTTQAWTMVGRIIDPSQTISLSVNGMPVDIQPGTDVSFGSGTFPPLHSG